MKTYNAIPTDLPPTALALGTFDGVHLGHRHLFQQLCKAAPHTTLLTFSNHPLEILMPTQAPSLLTPLPRKLHLLEAFPIDVVIAIPFTQEFARLSYEELLSLFPLTHLFLGEGDAFGANREGTPPHLARLSLTRGFSLTYVPKLFLDGSPISSQRIRQAIQAHNWHLASRLLGRTIQEASHV